MTARQFWLTLRAEAQVRRDSRRRRGPGHRRPRRGDRGAGRRADRRRAARHPDPHHRHATGKDGQDQAARASRSRSTRRRQDAPELPRRRVSARTTGKVYRAPDGRTYRPSMFLTLTCDTYGRVRDDGTPVNPATYDYARAARDAVHFPALFDRLIQNLRRYLGYDVQYFATIEPQRRLAPHVHIAFRGAISRNDLRKVIAATYHQVWWPSTDTVRFDEDQLPEWHEATGRYVDPATGEAAAVLGRGPGRHRPRRRAAARGPVRPEVRRPGRARRDPDSARCIGYLTKYLTKPSPDATKPAPTPSGTTPTGWPMRCGTSRARRRARTGCATASRPRTRGPG